MSEENKTFDQWCLLDLFGHQKTAGRVTEATIGGCAFIRIDVPEGNGYRTEYYGQGAIYSMRPVSEEIARAVVAHYTSALVSPYEVQDIMRRLKPAEPETLRDGMIDRRPPVDDDDDDSEEDP